MKTTKLLFGLIAAISVFTSLASAGLCCGWYGSECMGSDCSVGYECVQTVFVPGEEECACMPVSSTTTLPTTTTTLVCVPEGGTYPVVPGHPLCCEGLTAIDTSVPDSNGTCPEEPTVGAMICTYCGNGICGLGENKCNCPEDCTDIPVPEPASAAIAILLAAPAFAYLLIKQRR